MLAATARSCSRTIGTRRANAASSASIDSGLARTSRSVSDIGMPPSVSRFGAALLLELLDRVLLRQRPVRQQDDGHEGEDGERHGPQEDLRDAETVGALDEVL